MAIISPASGGEAMGQPCSRRASDKDQWRIVAGESLEKRYSAASAEVKKRIKGYQAPFEIV